MPTADEVDELLRARAEIDEQLRRHKNALTVLFTDVVGSTSFFERNGDTAGLVMIHRHDELAARAIEQHDGKVVKTIGDSAMAEFPTPASAVRAAVEIERQFLKLNSTLPQEQRAEVRIGVHTGVGFRRGSDLFGEVVNVAARIVKHTSPSQILISRAMYEAIAEEPGMSSRWLNRLTIDGRTEKEDIYEVVWSGVEAEPAAGDRPAGRSHFPARYEVLSQIGTGGTGIVYKVRDLETAEIVALKILRPEIASDPEVQENLKRELCLARKITHKNVCRIHEFSRSAGMAYMSMEFVEGECLSSKLSRSGSLPVNEALDITRQICAGLREAHAQGIVHRDLKPANIMLDRNGVVKIMDFGIARMIQRDGPMTGTIVGTPAYMAPEQAELKPVSSCTDIYALGLLLYEMITGVAAFDGDSPVAVALKQIREYPKRPREIVPDLSRAMQAVIMKCLQKDPAKRYQSVSQVELALSRAANARRATSWEAAIERGLLKAELGVRNLLRQAPDLMEAILELRDWRPLAKIREDQKAMLGITGMVAALTVFLVFGAWKPRTTNAQTVQAPSRNAALLAPAVHGSYSDFDALPAQNSLEPIASHEVDLYGRSKPVAGKTLSSAPGLPAHSSEAGREAPAAVSSTSSPLLKAVKSPVRPEERKSRPETRLATRLPALANPAAPKAAVSAAAPRTDARQSLNNTSQPATATATLLDRFLQEAKTSSRPLSTGDESDAPKLFIEVGAFKNEAGANHAVDKLTRLGFHAVLIRKNILWAQSYRVEVGPYADQNEFAEARQSLSSQGYDARPLN